MCHASATSTLILIYKPELQNNSDPTLEKSAHLMTVISADRKSCILRDR